MAVSGLEQRGVPLVVSSSVWAPWGPGLVSPLPEDDFDDHHDERQAALTPVKQKRLRSHSWGGYSTHAQLTSRGFVGESSSIGESDSPRKAKSDIGFSDRGRRNQWDRKVHMIQGGKPAPIVLANPPMLLGSRQPEAWQGAKTDHAGRQTSQALGLAAKPGAVESTEKTAITTLAIRNLPYSLAQQDLLQAVDESGFAGLYDFVYLPHKFKEHRNLGFAFINFVSEDVARNFTADWQHTHRFPCGSMRKPLNISPAVVQGRRANQQKATSHKMDRVKNSSFRPMLLDGSKGALGVC